MLSWKRMIAPVAALALLVGFQQAQLHADPAAPAGKATVTVTVVDSAGKAVSGATVGIYPKAAKKHKAGAADAGATTQPAVKTKPEALVSGETGADGTVALTAVPDGDYNVQARVKGSGNGRAAVTIADGKDTTVSVTLKPKKAAAGN